MVWFQFNRIFKIVVSSYLETTLEESGDGFCFCFQTLLNFVECGILLSSAESSRFSQDFIERAELVIPEAATGGVL